MTDIRASRCEELRGIMTDLIPGLIEAQGNREVLVRLAPRVDALRAVAQQGAEGIDDESYAHWTEVAEPNIQAMADAIDRGDAKEAWDAFRDTERGVALLAKGCEGYPGW
jgi:hypothetical protein